MPVNFPVDIEGNKATTAMHYPAAEPAGVLLILAHGAGAGQHHAFIVTTADGLATRGVDVVTFDFPYMHDRRRLPDKAPVLEQCFLDVIQAAQKHANLSARRLFIGGKSMGGRIATHLGARHLPGLEGIVALGYPLHPPGKPDQKRDAHLSSIVAPVLIVQGEHDAFGTPLEVSPVIESMTAPVTVHVVVGGDHSLNVRGRRHEDVHKEVLDLTARWMMTRPKEQAQA